MRQGGHDQAINVREDLLHWFARLRRRVGKLCFKIARLDLRKHRQLFDAVEIVGNPVDQFVTVPAKFFRAHVAKRGRKFLLGFTHRRAV